MARRARETTAAEFAPEVSSRPGAKAFADIAARSKSFRPAREVLRRVRAVPTIFPGVDYKLRVGGWPLDRSAMVHGPSGMGKTQLVQGVGLSFLKRGHMFAFIDAEMTTPHSWLELLFGEYADDPRFIAARPSSYEQAVDDVDRIANGIGDAKAKGKIDKDTSCFFAVDSIGKLVPMALMEKTKKLAAEHKDGSVGGMDGMEGAYRASLNKMWLDRLVPLMHDTGCAIAFVARESQDRNASANDRKYGTDWKRTGGVGLYYDASLDIRVAHAKMIHIDEDDYKSDVVGELHLVEIHKTKVSARERAIEKTWFSTSNGLLTPAGFDRARDLVELGTDLEVIKQGGAWYAFGGKRWQGKRNLLSKISRVPELLDELEAACRAKFDSQLRADIVGAP
jgi:recombination protein RecA